MKIILFSLLSLNLMLVSCKKNTDIRSLNKNEVFKKLPSFESIYKFALNDKASAKFMITSNSHLGQKDPSIYCHVNISGAFLDKTTQQNEIGQTNYFNDISIQPNEVNAYTKDLKWDQGKAFFGKNVNLKLHRGAPSAVGDTVIDYNGGYIPLEFISTNNFLDNVMTTNGNYVSGTKLNPTFKFSWNADSLNQNGVFVYVEYDPNAFGNDSIKITHPLKTANGIIVNDTGDYILSSELFDDIPMNARISVYIGRGNFSYIIQQNGTPTDMQMTALTYQYGEFSYKFD